MMRRCLWAVACIAIACGRAPAPGPPPPETAPPPAVALSAEDSARAVALFVEAEALFRAGEFFRADSLAGIVVEQYAGTPWAADALRLKARALREQGALTGAREAITRYLALFPEGDPRRASAQIFLAKLLLEGIEPWPAAETLLAAEPRMTGTLRDSAASLLREALGLLSLSDVNSLLDRHAARSPFSAMLHAERALQLAAEGRADEARAAAERALDSSPLPLDAGRARQILRAREQSGPPMIAAVLPLTGHLAPYGRGLLEGITLALEEHNRNARDTVHLVVVDDSSSQAAAARRVPELEARGVLGVVGPVADEGVRAAATRRASTDLVLVSPMAREGDLGGANVYSLWVSTYDLERLAGTIAEWGVRQMGARRIAVLFPGDPMGYTQYEAFARSARLHGAEIIAAEPYVSDATTYEAPLARIDSVNPEAIYAVATGARAVIQLAPQLSFYGLRGVQVFGDPNWVDPDVVRLLDPRFLNGAVIAAYMDRWSPESAWPRFEDLYEARYRKGLGSNIVPALGYDAASLLLRAVPTSMPVPGVLARSLRRATPYRGATGVMQVYGNGIRREPVVVEVRDRQVYPAFPHPIQRPPEPATADSLRSPSGRERRP